MLVSPSIPIPRSVSISKSPPFSEYKEAFALFDKRGTGAVPRETLGDLLRALGQNPTQAEVAEIVASAPRDGKPARPFFFSQPLSKSGAFFGC